MRAKEIKKASYVLGAPDWHNGDLFLNKVPTATFGQRFERKLVADTFNKQDRACEERLSRTRTIQAGGEPLPLVGLLHGQ